MGGEGTPAGLLGRNPLPSIDLHRPLLELIA